MMHAAVTLVTLLKQAFDYLVQHTTLAYSSWSSWGYLGLETGDRSSERSLTPSLCIIHTVK